MLPDFFFFFIFLFCLFVAFFFIAPRAHEGVNQAVRASSANVIRLEQLLFVKTFRLSAREVLSFCIPSRRPCGAQMGRFTE